MQKLISPTMVQKLCLRQEDIMGYLDSKMGNARTPSNHQTLKELASVFVVGQLGDLTVLALLAIIGICSLSNPMQNSFSLKWCKFLTQLGKHYELIRLKDGILFSRTLMSTGQDSGSESFDLPDISAAISSVKVENDGLRS